MPCGRVFQQLALLGTIIVVSTAAFCGKLGSFDALCIKQDAVYMLSVSPCHHKSDALLKVVQITVISKTDLAKGILTKYEITATKDHYNPMHTKFGKKNYGIMFEMHYHKHGPHKGHLHVDLSFGNFSDNGARSKKTFLDVYFYLERSGYCFDSFSGASHLAPHDCQWTKRTGNYSTLCISKPSASINKQDQGIFIIAVDQCTAPMSYWAVAIFPSKNKEIVERFTASKTDAFVPIENATCGFKTKLVPKNGHGRHDTLHTNVAHDVAHDDHDEHGEFYEHEHQNVMMVTNFGCLSAVSLMLYGCSDATAVQLINDYYFPEEGEMCMTSKCSSVNGLNRVCRSSMIVGKNKSVSIISNITVKGCARPFHVDAVITMEGQKYPLIAYFNKTAEMTDFKFDGKPQTETETKLPEIRNGYVPATGGHLMVLLERFDDMDHGVLEHRTDDEEDMPHLAFLIIDRHYDLDDGNYIAPLIFEEFTLAPCDSSMATLGRAKLSGGVIAIISISVIAVVAAIIVLTIYKRRAKKKPFDGLPYQIELNYDDPDTFEKDDL